MNSEMTTLYYLRTPDGRIHICDDEGAYCNADMADAVQVDVVGDDDVCEWCRMAPYKHEDDGQ